MAVRAVQEVTAPAVAGAVDLLGELVGGAGSEQYVAGLDGSAAREPQREADGRVDHAVKDELDAVAADLRSPGPEELGRGCAVA